MKSAKTFEGVECVTLDLDDTLWPIEPTISNAEKKLYDWFAQKYPKVTERYSFEEIAAKRSQLNLTREDISHNVTELRHCALMELADEFGYPIKFADDGLKLFRKFRNQVKPYPYSERLLTSLKHKYVLGAITNGNAQLDQIPLGKHFDFSVTAAQVGVSKPDPQIFIYASKLANVRVENMLHIGDSPQTDVIGSLNAGYRAIWFNSERKSWPGGQNPTKVIHCLSELPKLLNVPEIE